MKERLAIVNIETEDNLFIKVSDLISIRKIPDKVVKCIDKYMPDLKRMDSGLPAVGFVGRNGVKITGCFKYGEIVFISYLGKEEHLMKDELVHVFSNISEKDYDAMKEFAEAKLKELENEPKES